LRRDNDDYYEMKSNFLGIAIGFDFEKPELGKWVRDSVWYEGWGRDVDSGLATRFANDMERHGSRPDKLRIEQLKDSKCSGLYGRLF
jgi:hypothetical protein